MLQSMTGFGSARLDSDQYSICVEIRSLNSKGMDLNVRTPRYLNDKEYEIRNMVTKALVRGKVSVTVDYSKNKSQKAKNNINRELLQVYYNELSQAADAVGASKQDLFRLALHMPEVLQQEQDEEAGDADWSIVQPLLEEALKSINTFRADEGKALTAEIMAYIDRIRILLAEIDKHDPVRMENIRNRVRGHLTEISNSESFDKNRFEQEMVYFMEKLDIAEEKVRLINHLHYFTETVYLPEPTGKKLGFISQEIGREINTIGSKANDATIQHYVVEMKEELEKIKEQINNIL
ncbi:YicC/YloC family endoribonuclease [Pontibacter cellulosilyticus]|uniref:YicC family protein n=1 Tax=Pontibacter cellulosilyticus TaxID=1720253 RepID=A0A923SJH2_9BACT|nr:YicC/YloC family endoribonuclease [Pontibacter cellulosilyticus]MBC5993818.1 YicC family protein [Pontibacter cellulosilyticus]